MIVRQILPGSRRVDAEGSLSPDGRPPAPKPGSDATAVPNAAAKDQSAASVHDKLSRYLLNPEHPIGGAKARWFRQALGFGRENTAELSRQLVFDEAKAVPTAATKFATKFIQTINVVGPNGRTIPVVTAWIKGQDGPLVRPRMAPQW